MASLLSLQLRVIKHDSMGAPCPLTPDELATFKVKHPEWLIGERKYGDVTSFRTPLNFAIPEVRELKFRVIEELFKKYDFDGLEIDFLRSAPYFLPGEESKNAHLLTELLQRVRKHLDERGRQRGRPIRLAAVARRPPGGCPPRPAASPRAPVGRPRVARPPTGSRTRPGAPRRPPQSPVGPRSPPTPSRPPRRGC